MVGWREKSICSMVPREAGIHMGRTHITKVFLRLKTCPGLRKYTFGSSRWHELPADYLFEWIPVFLVPGVRAAASWGNENTH